jgi:hypothetical protein
MGLIISKPAASSKVYPTSEKQSPKASKPGAYKVAPLTTPLLSEPKIIRVHLMPKPLKLTPPELISRTKNMVMSIKENTNDDIRFPFIIIKSVPESLSSTGLESSDLVLKINGWKTQEQCVYRWKQEEEIRIVVSTIDGKKKTATLARPDDLEDCDLYSKNNLFGLTVSTTIEKEELHSYLTAFNTFLSQNADQLLSKSKNEIVTFCKQTSDLSNNFSNLIEILKKDSLPLPLDTLLREILINISKLDRSEIEERVVAETCIILSKDHFYQFLNQFSLAVDTLKKQLIDVLTPQNEVVNSYQTSLEKTLHFRNAQIKLGFPISKKHKKEDRLIIAQKAHYNAAACLQESIQYTFIIKPGLQFLELIFKQLHELKELISATELVLNMSSQKNHKRQLEGILERTKKPHLTMQTTWENIVNQQDSFVFIDQHIGLLYKYKSINSPDANDSIETQLPISEAMKKMSPNEKNTLITIIQTIQNTFTSILNPQHLIQNFELEIPSEVRETRDDQVNNIKLKLRAIPPHLSLTELTQLSNKSAPTDPYSEPLSLAQELAEIGKNNTKLDLCLEESDGLHQISFVQKEMDTMISATTETIKTRNLLSNLTLFEQTIIPGQKSTVVKDNLYHDMFKALKGLQKACLKLLINQSHLANKPLRLEILIEKLTVQLKDQEFPSDYIDKATQQLNLAGLLSDIKDFFPESQYIHRRQLVLYGRIQILRFNLYSQMESPSILKLCKHKPKQVDMQKNLTIENWDSKIKPLKNYTNKKTISGLKHYLKLLEIQISSLGDSSKDELFLSESEFNKRLNLCLNMHSDILKAKIDLMKNRLLQSQLPKSLSYKGFLKDTLQLKLALINAISRRPTSHSDKANFINKNSEKQIQLLDKFFTAANIVIAKSVLNRYKSHQKKHTKELGLPDITRSNSLALSFISSLATTTEHASQIGAIEGMIDHLANEICINIRTAAETFITNPKNRNTRYEFDVLTRTQEQSIPLGARIMLKKILQTKFPNKPYETSLIFTGNKWNAFRVTLRVEKLQSYETTSKEEPLLKTEVTNLNSLSAQHSFVTGEQGNVYSIGINPIYGSNENRLQVRQGIATKTGKKITTLKSYKATTPDRIYDKGPATHYYYNQLRSNFDKTAKEIWQTLAIESPDEINRIFEIMEDLSGLRQFGSPDNNQLKEFQEYAKFVTMFIKELESLEIDNKTEAAKQIQAVLIDLLQIVIERISPDTFYQDLIFRADRTDGQSSSGTIYAVRMYVTLLSELEESDDVFKGKEFKDLNKRVVALDENPTNAGIVDIETKLRDILNLYDRKSILIQALTNTNNETVVDALFNYGVTINERSYDLSSFISYKVVHRIAVKLRELNHSEKVYDRESIRSIQNKLITTANLIAAQLPGKDIDKSKQIMYQIFIKVYVQTYLMEKIKVLENDYPLGEGLMGLKLHKKALESAIENTEDNTQLEHLLRHCITVSQKDTIIDLTDLPFEPIREDYIESLNMYYGKENDNPGDTLTDLFLIRTRLYSNKPISKNSDRKNYLSRIVQTTLERARGEGLNSLHEQDLALSTLADIWTEPDNESFSTAFETCRALFLSPRNS